MSFNKLSGQIPASILSQCSQLQELDLSYNIFSGTLPREIGNMTQLQKFYAYRNNITGMVYVLLGIGTIW
ncbi:Non-specific serine/threonine protein kinase [Handroanthus impetiginosus]|uniref:Non-specific serine/threonine protein kinase n=1 Tax=Handroanthus impetiginosus TaxID=429701 RepID=A0A2G9FVN1_9LAMI|nr:Non-specific serine/threonine protein kinase [Handroanthus impetiginosus]